MTTDWTARRQRTAEFKALSRADTSDPALIQGWARTLVAQFGDTALGQAQCRARHSSTAKVRAFWASVAAYITKEQTE